MPLPVYAEEIESCYRSTNYSNVGLMLGQRCRLRPNIKPAFDNCLGLAGKLLLI